MALGLAVGTPGARTAHERVTRGPPLRPLLNLRLAEAGFVAFGVQLACTAVMLLACIEVQ